jgi:hypothetical protein
MRSGRLGLSLRDQNPNEVHRGLPPMVRNGRASFHTACERNWPLLISYEIGLNPQRSKVPWKKRQRAGWETPPVAVLRKRARVLVIDDSEFTYLPLFARDGYRIDHWSEIRDLSALESGDFDVILLDLHGVGTQESANSGLGVLQHLRNVSPTQMVVAYSSVSWPLADKKFFDLADRTLSKTDDYLDFKEAVDALIVSRFSFSFFEARARAELHAAGVADKGLTDALGRALDKKSTDPIRGFLERSSADPHLVDRVLLITNVLLETFRLLSTVTGH